MALTSDDETQIELLDYDKNSKVKYVSSVDGCSQISTSDKSRKDYDSDSGESLFITQCVASPRRTVRRERSTKRSKFISDSSECGGEERCLETEEDIEYEDEGVDRRTSSRRRKKKKIGYIAYKKTQFPFLLKSLGHQHLPLHKYKILENSEIGGFLKCLKKVQEGYVGTKRREICEDMASDDLQVDEENSDHEVTVVDRADFFPNASKKNKLKWHPKSILKRQTQGTRSKDKKDSVEKTDINFQEDLPHSNMCTRSKTKYVGKDVAVKSSCTPLESPVVCLSDDKEEGQSKNVEVLASCTDDELSDSDSSKRLLTRRTFHSGQHSGDEATDEGQFCIIEETQRLNTEVTDSEDVRAETDNSSLSQHQEGDISITNQMQDVSGSETLLPDEDEEENEDKNNNMFKTQVSNEEDSDVTQIDTDGESDSKSGLVMQRQEDKSHQCSSQSISMSPDSQSLLFRGEHGENANYELRNLTNKPQMLSDAEVATNNEFSEVEDGSKRLIAPDVELVSDEELENEMMLLANVENVREEAGVIKESSVEPHIFSNSCKDTDETSDSPLFKHVGPSFLRRKRKKEEKNNEDLKSMQHDVGVDASFAYDGDDITGLETAPKHNRESRKVEDDVTDEERIQASLLSKKSSRFSVSSDSSVVSKAKKKKKKLTLEEQEDAGLVIDSQQAQERSIRTIKKFKESDNDSTINKSLAHVVNRPLEQEENESIQATEIGQSELAQKPQGVTHEPSGATENLKRNRKSQRSLAQGDDITALKEASESLETTCDLVDITKVIKNKKQKLQEQEDTQQDQDTDSTSKRTKKKYKESDNDATIKLSNKNLARIVQRPLEEEVNDSTQATKIGQSEHAQHLEGVIQESGGATEHLKRNRKSQRSLDQGNDITALREASESLETTCNLVVITKVKKKKKKQTLEEQEDTQQDRDTDSTSKSTKKKSKKSDNDATIKIMKTQEIKDSIQFTGQSEHAQNLEGVTQESSGTTEHLEENWERSLSQDDDITALKEVSESLETTCDLEFSDCTVITKVKKKKKNKQKQQFSPDIHSVENVQDSDSQITLLSSKKKKKRRDKKREWTCNQENNETVMPSNDISENITEIPVGLGANILNNSSKAHHTDDTQEPEELRCLSASETIIKVKKKKKKKRDGSDRHQPDSEEENRSTAQKFLVKTTADVVEHLKTNFNEAEHKNKTKEVSIDFVVQSEESVSTEMRKKKKKKKKERFTDDIMKVNSEVVDHKAFGKSGSPVSTPHKKRSKKAKKKNNEEITEEDQGAGSKSHAIGQTKETDSDEQQNNDNRELMVTSLEDSGDVRIKKKKKHIVLTEVTEGDTPQKPVKERQKRRERESSDANILLSKKIQDTECNPKNDSGTEEFLESRKRKKDKETFDKNMQLDSKRNPKKASGTVSAEDILESHSDGVPLCKKKKRNKDKETFDINIPQSNIIQDTESNQKNNSCAVSTKDFLESHSVRKKKKRKRDKVETFNENVQQSHKIQDTECNLKYDSGTVSTEDFSESSLHKKKKRKRDKEGAADETVKSKAEEKEAFIRNSDVLLKKKKKRKWVENNL